MKKQLLLVGLDNGQEEVFEAERYRREGDQYVFESDGDNEVQFCDARRVLYIKVLPRSGLESYGGGAY